MPLPILTAAQMKVCDDHTIHTVGIPSKTLMERAAAKAADRAAMVTAAVSQPSPTSFLNRPWTDTHDDRLRSMYAAGATVPEMADAIKRTEEGIMHRLRELGLN